MSRLLVRWIENSFLGRIARAVNLNAAVLVVATAALAGCGGSDIPVTPVHGTITIDGKPLAGGRIMFAPQPSGDNIAPGKPAYGRLDDQGHYELSTFGEGDGAVIGAHLVTITSRRDAAESPSPAFRSLIVPSAREVKSGETNQIDFTLSADDVAKFGR